MFCGQFVHTLDEKNRFKVPASLRSKMGVETYLIKSPDPSAKCLYMYSEEGWNELYEQFTKGDRHDETTRRVSRKILSGVVYGEIDKGGRLTLNAALKEFAGIETDICIVGNTRHIALWSPEEWEKEMAAMDVTPTASLNIDF